MSSPRPTTTPLALGHFDAHIPAFHSPTPTPRNPCQAPHTCSTYLDHTCDGHAIPMAAPCLSVPICTAFGRTGTEYVRAQVTEQHCACDIDLNPVTLCSCGPAAGASKPVTCDMLNSLACKQAWVLVREPSTIQAARGAAACHACCQVVMLKCHSGPLARA